MDFVDLGLGLQIESRPLVHVSGLNTYIAHGYKDFKLGVSSQ